MRLFGWEIAIRRKSTLVPSSPGWRNLFGFVRESFAGAWQRGVTIDDRQTLLQFGALFACVSRIAGDIAKLRVCLVERDANGIWNEASDRSPFWAVLRKPNHYQTRIQFLIAWLLSKLLFGNVYVLKERDARSIVSALHVLDPRRVTPLVAEDGGVYYQLGIDPLAGLGEQRTVMATVPASEIIHDRGMTLFHPLVGVSPIFACGLAATQGNRIQNNSAAFFENMSRPSGILTAPGAISDDTANRLKAHWEQNFTGGNLGKVAVLGDALKYEGMTIPAEDAQLIEQLRWTGEDVCRAFGVPGYKVGVGPVPTSNNVEALEQQYYSGTLQLLIESIEALLDEGLALPPQLGTEFDLDGLLRMDTATMFEALGKATGAGIMAPNEARRKINLAPVKGGEQPYLQQQNFSLGALAERDADKPFAKPTPAPPAPVASPSGEPAPALPAPEEAAAKAFLDALLKEFEAEHV